MAASVNPTDEQQPRQISMLIGDNDAETLHNIGCILQVLADAALTELSSPDARHGWWLLLQEISLTALAARSDHTPTSEGEY